MTHRPFPAGDANNGNFDVTVDTTSRIVPLRRGLSGVRIANTGTVGVRIASGGTNAVAVSPGALTVGVPALCSTFVLPNSVEIFTVEPGFNLAVKTDSGSTTLNICQGDGF